MKKIFLVMILFCLCGCKEGTMTKEKEMPNMTTESGEIFLSSIPVSDIVFEDCNEFKSDDKFVVSANTDTFVSFAPISDTDTIIDIAETGTFIDFDCCDENKSNDKLVTNMLKEITDLIDRLENLIEELERKRVLAK